MIHSVSFDPDALADLAARFDYLKPRAGERIARDQIAKLFGYCLAFEAFPERSRRRDDLRPGLRVVGYRRQPSIAFTLLEDEVLISRIVFAGQQIEPPGASAES